MSYLYSFYNCFNFYPQAVYPQYTQPESQNVLRSLYLAKSQLSLLQTTSPEQFEAILISGPKSSKIQAPLAQKQRAKGETKQIKRGGSTKKDENFGWRNQNKQRNVISSILKRYVHHILHDRGMEKLIEDLSIKKQVYNGVSKFHEFVGRKFPAQKTYVGIRYIREIIAQKPDGSPMALILSISLRHYLKQIYPLQIIQNSKMRRKIRMTFLKKARSILAMLFMS